MTSTALTEPTAKSNRAAVLHGIGEILIEERAVPLAAPDEVLVRVEAVGICGSDAHYFREGRIGSFELDGPLVLGHEASGTIVQAGAEVDQGRVGERVAIEPGIPCGRCVQCHRGDYNLCPDVRFFATPPVDGAFQHFVAVRADFAFRMPEEMTFEQGALVEPTAVALWAARKAGVQPGSRVLVTGAGPVGLLTLQVARALGASHLAITDVDLDKLRLARDLGADQVWAAGDIAMAGSRFDVHIECSGNLDAAHEGLAQLDRGGVCVLVGMGGSDELGLDIPSIQEKELLITGTFRYANCYPAAIDLISSGRVQTSPLVTARFALDETAEALRQVGVASAQKLIVNPQL